MSATHCLNCNTPLQGAYCHACGQKGSTHRLSLWHFLIHDAVHGLWHVDGSFFYTLGQVVRRPGKAALEYIAGKRRKFFNLVTLLLIIAGTTVFIRHALHKEKTVTVSSQQSERPAALPDTNSARTQARAISIAGGLLVVDTAAALEGDRRPNRIGRMVKNWVQENQKWVLLSFIPLISLASVIVYRCSRLNYTEHLVVAAFCLAGALVVGLASTLLREGLARAFGWQWSFNGIVVFLFGLMAYWQAHRHRYSIGGWLWRTIAALLMFALLFMLVASMIVLIATYLTEGPAFFDE